MIVTRFAPSPTGLLHLGHAYAALFAYEAAAQAGGRCLLRIEDIDRQRCRPEYETAIKEDILWLGLRFPENPRRQSEHFADYAAALARLDEKGLLYPCFCTRKEIADEIARAASAPHANAMGPDGPLYPGICRALSSAERKARMAENLPYALRLDIEKALAYVERALSFEEQGRGPEGQTGLQTAKPSLFGDAVLARKDMPASYHLAVVVDDALQGVSLVTRGEDLFAAAHLQRLLQALLDLPTPAYRHHRLILDAEGRKFSKRNKAATLADLRQSGVSVEALRARIGL
jgi:glutamyl-Q tRNA(Asp) synthetase